MVTPPAIDWDEDIEIDPEEDFKNLIRGLKYKQGFGLFFVCCGQENEQDLIKRIQEEVSQKKIDILALDKPIDNLYNLVKPIYQTQEIDTLLITGLGYALLDYELKTFGEITETRYDNFSDIPAILNHLNQQRERFRDCLPISYVFFIPLFVLKYVIKRTPDFFDWRSGYWQFPLDKESADNKAFWLYINGSFEEYKKLSPAEKAKKILEIQDLLSVETLAENRRIDLLIELAKMLIATENLENALTTLNQVMKRQPDNEDAWFYRGNALGNLGRFDEAILSYDKAIEIKPDYHEAWNNRGNALFNLGRLDEAILSYDKAIEIKPDYHQAWNNRGDTSKKLGRFKKTLSSFDKAIEFKLDDHQAWYNYGNALFNLGRLDEAISSYDKAIEFKPDYHQAWYNRGIALGNLGRLDEAILSYDKAIEFKPDKHQAWYNRGNTLGNLGRLDEAILSYDKAIEFKPNKHEAWYNRGNALSDLGRLDEAILSYDKAIKFKPNFHEVYYNKACAYALQNNVTLAVENLQSGINLDESYGEMAKTDSDFDGIRDEEQFKRLLM
ncbi:MAG: tetratricopeptide repeat protein [Microcystaceae cyanobacterium]